LKVTRGEIRLENVSFGYGRRKYARDDGRPFAVLDGLSLTVKPGEKIGLIGRSGAGKSTLVNLLLRFFDLEGGRILIDSQDISAVTQESLRAQISTVTQDTSLLHRSIGDNIRYGRPQATEAEIVVKFTTTTSSSSTSICPTCRVLRFCAACAWRRSRRRS